jgi:hypothetical protein
MNRAVARWRRRESLAAWEKALERALENSVPADEEFDAVEPPKPLEQVGPAIDPWWFRFTKIEDAWRWDAQAAGLSPEEIEESWAWYSANASGAPPVLEEAKGALPEAMPDSARRVLTRNIRYIFLAEDSFVEGLLNEFKQPIPDDLRHVADEWGFWDDVGYALTDPSDAGARPALDRLVQLVRLKPEAVRHLAEKNDTTMAATKRRLIHEAVLLSLAAAEERIRIGRRTVKGDPGHPITLEDVFGREGLQDILDNLASGNRESAKEDLERSLGGPVFRPAHLADRAVYRSWLTKEIRRRTTELLGQDLDIKDPGRAGGSRRKEISYDETEPLAGVARGPLGAKTQAFTDRELRAAGDREDKEQASVRTTYYYAGGLQAWEKKDRMESALAHRIDWQLALDRVWREHEAPVLRQYIDCVRHEILFLHDDVAAARHLNWTEDKVWDVKRRLHRQIALITAERRWKSRSPKTL